MNLFIYLVSCCFEMEMNYFCIGNQFILIELLVSFQIYKFLIVPTCFKSRNDQIMNPDMK